MKTDTIFYRLFQTFPQIFFELINLSPTLAQNYRFDSVEIKQLSFRIDGVFLPLRPDSPFYFAEVQFQPDSEFYSRFITESLLYLNQSDLSNNWLGVAIFPNRRIDNSPTERYQEMFDSGRIRRIYLDELGEMSRNSPGLATIFLVIADQESAIAKGQELIERVKVEVESPQQRDLLELIERILVYKLPQISREELERMFGLNDLRHTRVWQEAKEEGLAEGKLEGKLESKFEAIPRLQALGLSVEQIAVALDLTLEQVCQFVGSDSN
ncbi:MAG: Rpn family recombination-promoting nuclease/putative transposase [Jaaginema sp. PMC 1079.18]|nr:Rpn family recombination-promoting nuclease/putative transposase [Jaaginema sp. PMC 1080.18]MEC4851770.1 Rpn family recombination-promoting nuclease/putative transposase [Jaaginema sp. PMC 1079.18]MEC4864520.1 Rpn family recombination-promoting nuclease/putative transposase [Jaaginema sp. PMC 1078.18]